MLSYRRETALQVALESIWQIWIKWECGIQNVTLHLSNISQCVSIDWLAYSGMPHCIFHCVSQLIFMMPHYQNVWMLDLNHSSVIILLAGATVGHRALMRYYRQKLKPDRQIAISRNTSAVAKVISQYKAIGWTGTSGLKFYYFFIIFF